MSLSLNKVTLIGNVGNDPETRDVNGKQLARFSLATSERWKDAGGEWQEKTDWHNIAVWGKLADMVRKHISKGRRLYIEGRISYRTVERDGTSIKYVDIVAQTIKFVDKKPQKNRSQDNGADYHGTMAGMKRNARDEERKEQERQYQNRRNGSGPDFDDEDIPF